MAVAAAAAAEAPLRDEVVVEEVAAVVDGVRFNLTGNGVPEPVLDATGDSLGMNEGREEGEEAAEDGGARLKPVAPVVVEVVVGVV